IFWTGRTGTTTLAGRTGLFGTLTRCTLSPPITKKNFDSKNIISDKTFNLLVKLAKEHRNVLHAALRHVSNQQFEVNGNSVVEGVNGVLQHVKGFSEQIRNGEWLGYTRKKIQSIVNIGIGGFDLGPVMVTEALKA
ncbi:glucose-6-phosphate isomerase, partial [Rhizina undulata]